VGPLRLSALFECLLARDAAALRGRLPAVRLERVTARKEVPALLAEGDLQRVPLLGIAVPLEVFPRLERRVGTELALDLANRATCPVGLRGRDSQAREQAPCTLSRTFSETRAPLPLIVAAAPVPVAPAPPPHSPLPKSVVRPQFVPPALAGNSVPARVDGEFPARLGSQASPLRVPPPWVH
jgi:hypothetical protein